MATVGVVPVEQRIRTELNEDNPESTLKKTLNTYRAFMELHDMAKNMGVDAKINAKHILDYAYASTLLPNLDRHRNLYVIGFILILIGVVFQVAANGIAWAAAYGLIS